MTLKSALMASAMFVAAPVAAQTTTGAQPTQSAPAQPAPAQSAPAQSVPAQSAPAQPADHVTMPETGTPDPVPDDPANDIVPGQQTISPAAGEPVITPSPQSRVTQTAPVQPAPAQPAATAAAPTNPAPSPDAQVVAIIDHEFPTYDVDHDGSLSRAEFGTWMVVLRKKNDPTSTADSPETTTWLTAAFAQADTDKSMLISKPELISFLIPGRTATTG